MGLKTAARWRAPRWAGATCLRVLLATGATLAATCTSATAAPAHHLAARAEYPLCSTFFSATEITKITGLSTELAEGQPMLTGPGKLSTVYWSVNQSGPVYTGNIPGSTCVWSDTHGPSSYRMLETATVNVGYGESLANWSVLAKQYKASQRFDYLGVARYGPLELGHGSQAFLDTIDLWSYYNVKGPAAVGGFPQYMYGITVLTKRHDILQVAFINASLAKTTSVVDGFLVDNPWF